MVKLQRYWPAWFPVKLTAPSIGPRNPLWFGIAVVLILTLATLTPVIRASLIDLSWSSGISDDSDCDRVTLVSVSESSTPPEPNHRAVPLAVSSAGPNLDPQIRSHWGVADFDGRAPPTA
jgi:hypothetical protein